MVTAREEKTLATEDQKHASSFAQPTQINK